MLASYVKSATVPWGRPGSDETPDAVSPKRSVSAVASTAAGPNDVRTAVTAARTPKSGDEVPSVRQRPAGKAGPPKEPRPAATGEISCAKTPVATAVASTEPASASATHGKSGARSRPSDLRSGARTQFSSWRAIHAFTRRLG